MTGFRQRAGAAMFQARCDTYSGDTARNPEISPPLQWGIATDCVLDTELEAATDALAEELAGFPPLAQRTAKKLLNDIEDATLSLGIELEGQAYGRLRYSDDFRKGVEAFHQKRKPQFRGT